MSYINMTLNKLVENKSLTFEEAQKAMEEIMTGKVSPVKLASWLTALRMKGETPEEIAGCAAVMSIHATKIACSDPKAIDIVGTGGDGSHTFNISTAAAFIAAGAGITVAKHGNRAVSSLSGSADVLSELGVNINLGAIEIEACLNKIGIAFLFAPLLHTAMKHAMPVRKELGMRTVFNILGPLSNPAGIKRIVLGVYDKNLCLVVAKAAVSLGVEYVMVVHGNDGLDEITTTTSTHICEVHNTELREYEFDPVALGMSRACTEDLKGKSSSENAKLLRAIISGKEKGRTRDIVLLNAAAGILVAGKAPDWSRALTEAEKSITSGNAFAKLNALIDFTNSAK